MTSTDPMAEIRASFFIECEELLDSLQDGLTEIDNGNDDIEIVNVCFRAVHSIKGGAGAFGLDTMARFAHRYEAVLDNIRSGRLIPDHEAVLLFMRAADVLADIVSTSRDGAEIDPAAFEPTLKELEALVGASEDEEELLSGFQPLTLSFDFSLPDLSPPEAETGPPTYEIVFRPERELFQSGNEPLFLLLALRELGNVDISCDLSDLPDISYLDPEGAAIGWTIRLETNRDRREIEEIFDFVEGLCTLTITRLEPEAPAPLPPLPELPEPDDTAGPGDLSPLPPSPVPVSPLRTEAQLPPENAGQQAPLPAIGRAQPAPAAPAAANPTIRVEIDRIERLSNLVGELVINQAMLSQSAEQEGIPANSPVMQELEDFMQLTRDIQDSVMMIRAQPVKSLFQRMARIVRESSASLGKNVRFVTLGEATEVDKTVIERLVDPLTHMIRNAVDHGLEPAAKRLAAGKAEEGCITLSAAHRSGRVIIEVSDDGGGINREKVRAIAETKGLIAPGLALSDQEIDALLFLPGFSTTTEVSHLSGRGVGMDVVLRSIQALGGRIAISSTLGQGTRFTISLPLTMAILDGMVIEAAGETLVVPLAAIVETMMIRTEDLRTIGAGNRVIRIRDGLVPLIDLGVVLGFGKPRTVRHGSVALLVALEDGRVFALLVDAIHEQRQVVIKGLQDCYRHMPGIAAATILGDGHVALILDPSGLVANPPGQPQSIPAPLDLAG